MTQRTFRRAGGPGRRTRPIRRASAGLTPTRAGAALAMLVSALAVYGLSATSAFGFGRLEIDGAILTSEAAIRDRLELVEGQNLFEIATEPLEARIREIPAVAAVDISLGLPDTVAVQIVERVPILVWQIGERRLLVDDSRPALRAARQVATRVRRRPAGRPRRPGQLGQARRRAPDRPCRSRRGDAPRLADPGRGRQRRERAVGRRDRRERLRAQLGARELGRGLRLLHARPCEGPISCRARSRRCASC